MQKKLVTIPSLILKSKPVLSGAFLAMDQSSNSDDEFLVELLSCHRSVPWPILARETQKSLLLKLKSYLMF